MRVLGYISVLLCFIFVFFNYINIFSNIDFKKNKLMIILILIVIATGVIALNTDPYIGDDLTRHFAQIDNFRDMGLAYLGIFPYKSEIFTLLLFYLTSLMNFNNFLPFLVTVTFFSACALFIMKYLDEETPTANISLFFVIFSSFVYLNEIISGVRFPFALAVFLIVLIYDKNKGVYYNILYLLPIFIHFSTILLFLLMVLSKIAVKFKINRMIKLIILIFPYACLAVAKLFPTNIPFISNLFNKLLIYSDPNFYLSFLDWRVQLCVFICFIIIVIIYTQNKKVILEKVGSSYNCFYSSLICFCIGVSPYPLIFGRFFSLFVILSFPILMKFDKSRGKTYKFFFCILVILSLGLFAYRMVNAINYWRFY